MGLRTVLLGLLSRGDHAEPDPDGWCELATVPLFDAPLLAQRLEAGGVEVVQQESFDVVTKTLGAMTFLVRRSDLAAAQEISRRG